MFFSAILVAPKMSYPALVYNVMVGSPSDIASALSVVREALARWNVMHSQDKGVVFLPMSWETHSSPELDSSAQAVINRQLISRSDLLIAVFWTRLGTPTGEADSGTVEEILKHIEQGKPVMLYFCEKDVPFSQLHHDQHAKLGVFRSKVEGLYDTFKTDDQLHEKVERHLNEKLREHPYFAAARANRSPVSETATQSAVSEDALLILVEATKDPRGQLARIPTNSGVVIATNKKEARPQNPRDSATNEKIIKELENAGFIEDLGYQREVFQVTEAGFEYVDENGPAATREPGQAAARRTHFLELSKRLPDIVGSTYLREYWLELQKGLSEAEFGAGLGVALEESERKKRTKKELLGFVSNGIKSFSLILPAVVEPLIRSLANLARDASSEEQKNFRENIHGTIPPGLAIWLLLDALRRSDLDLLDAVQLLGIDLFAIESFVPFHPKKTRLDDLATVLGRSE